MQKTEQRPPEPPPPPPKPLDNLDLVGSDAQSGVREDQESRKERRLFGAPKRREQFDQVVHVVRVIILCVAVLVGLSAFIVRVLHFILPENNAANAGLSVHGWLTEGQLGSMDKFVFGALSAFLAQHMRKALISGNQKNAVEE